eukprot:symbB.v1.2.027056.t1/scaffold2750.1/size124631/1
MTTHSGSGIGEAFGTGSWSIAGFLAGGLPATCGSSFWTLSGLVLWDCLIFAGVLVLPYGIMVEILAFWNVAFRGNRFEYVTATKALATEMQSRPLLTT